MTEQLEDARKWQSANGRKQEIGINVIQKPDTVKEGTRFTSKNGASKQENQMLASAYHENGWTLSEIAETLHLATSTIKSYLATMNKHYEVKFIQGVRHIIFDSEYGDTDWNLNLYAKLDDKYTDYVAI